MNELLELDPRYSTTRLLVKTGQVLNSGAFKVIESAVRQSRKPEDKFETALFLPAGEGRQGEGGLRTRGYFKIGGLISKNTVTMGEEVPAIIESLRGKSSARKYKDSANNIASGGLSHDKRSEVTENEVASSQTPKILPITAGTPSSLTLQPPTLITVITVVYNGEKFLEETILSVINQNYENVEYIIIDGGSTDGTIDIIKKYEHAIDYWISEKDKGIYDAMNKGICLATGRWLNFMNADDFFAFNDVIKRVVSAIDNVLKDVVIIYGALSLINKDGDLLQTINNSPRLVEGLIKTKLAIPHQAQFIRLDAIRENDKFKPGYRIAADYEMTIRLLKAGRCHQINGVNIAKMRSGGLSSNPINSKELLLEYRKAQVENEIGVTGKFVLLWIKLYLRKFLWKVLGESITKKILDFGKKMLRREDFLV